MFARLLVLVLVLAARGADADGGGAACATSSIGYACSVALESGMNLHWTLGPADATSQVASVADGDIAIALAGTSDGMVGVSFPSAHAMSPANAVLGWINADGSGGSIGPYAMSSRSTPSSGGLALSSSSVTKSGGVTIIAFATTRSAVMTDDAHRLGYVGWARATSKANVKHDVSKGTVYLNYLTGNAGACVSSFIHSFVRSFANVLRPPLSAWPFPSSVSTSDLIAFHFDRPTERNGPRPQTATRTSRSRRTARS